MRTYACDWCRRSRNPGESWLLGFAAERIGATGVQREISMAGRWSSVAAAHPLAVHFCCAAHRNAYVEALFSEETEAVRSVRRSRSGASAKRGDSTISVGLGACALQSREEAPKARRYAKPASAAKPKAPRSARARFDFGDSIRSHALGVRLDENAQS